MQIFVKPANSKTITLNVEAEDTIMLVKVMIQSRIGTPRSEQRLVFGGSEVEDDSTLAQLNVVDGSRLTMKVSGLGGAGKKAGVIKITKAERMMLAQSRATTLYANVKPFTVEPSLVSKANTKYQELIKATETDMEETIKAMTLKRLLDAQEGCEEFILNEQSIHRLAPLFLKEMKELKSLEVNLQSAMKSLEAAFSYMFSNCYYSEHYAQFDFVSFNSLVTATIKEKECEKALKAKHGICEDVDEDL